MKRFPTSAHSEHCLLKNPLNKLNPILVNDIPRVGGRLENARHPIIMLHVSHLTNLIVKHCHEAVSHGGINMTMNLVAQPFWIVKCTSAVRRVIKDCMHCRRKFAKPQEQVMADLPFARLQLNTHPFACAEMDLLLISRLKDKKLLESDAKITFYRNWETGIFPFSSLDNDLVYCNNIIGLLLKMKIPNYRPEDWRLFIDSSKRSLKCVLLHNGNRFASTPIAHSTKLKEEYDNIKTVLQRICYEKHQWSICVDLKMVNFLFGQQTGYTKYFCFMCL